MQVEIGTTKISKRVKIAIRLYKKTSNSKLRRWLEKRIAEWTGGFAYSEIIRKLYKEEHGLEIGYGTYGGVWIHSGLWWQNIKIGNYCSFAGNVDMYSMNHPMQYFSTSLCLYSPLYGEILTNRQIDMKHYQGLEIGNDVWMGTNAVILPSCNKVGNGAIIGAGSIVTHDVPPYAIVAGNPAKILRYRFDEETIEKLETTQWWNLKLNELKEIAPKLQEIVTANQK